MGLPVTIHEYDHYSLVPSLLSHVEKEFGEMHIQFWFHVARSGCGQSDYRMVPRHSHVWQKNCNSDLKEPDILSTLYMVYLSADLYCSHDSG